MLLIKTGTSKCTLIMYLCVLRLDEVEKPLLQTSHMCGFSPVWVRVCRFNRLGRSKHFPHT